MNFYAVYAADVVDAFRALSVRVRRRKSGVVWFALLFAGSVWIALKLVEIALTVGLPANLQVTTGALLFAAFFGMLAKGAVDAYHRAVRPESLVFLLVQPVPRGAVALGKFLTVLWFNLAFVAAALALAVAFVAAGLRVPLPWEFAASLVLAVVSGLASGFALAVLGSLSSWRRKLAGLASYAPVIGFGYASLVAANASLRDSVLVLASLTVVSLAAIVASARFLVEAWNNQTAGRRRPGKPRHYVRLADAKLEALVDLELKTMVRKRQLLLTFGTILIVGISLLATYAVVGQPAGLPPSVAGVFYPFILAAAVYVAAATQLTVPGLAALGKELDRLWILRSLPVPGRTAYAAKTLVILLLVPAIIMGVALPLPLFAGFPVAVTAFIVLVSAAACLALVALGVYAGARSPNFDPNTGGLPDSIAMYNVFLAALVVAFIVVALPAQVYQHDFALGIMAAILAADVAVALVVFATTRAARRYDAIAA